jgi:hypothetical protein
MPSGPIITPERPCHERDNVCFLIASIIRWRGRERRVRVVSSGGYYPQRTAAIGATSSLAVVFGKVRSQSDLPT